MSAASITESFRVCCYLIRKYARAHLTPGAPQTRRWSRVGDADVAEVFRLRARGLKVSDIARAMGRPATTIRHIIKTRAAGQAA